MKIVNLNFFKNKNKSTQEIIEGCRLGDTSCQKILFKRYAPLIMTVCRRYEHPDFGASDLLQETFILVFKNIKQYDVNKGSIEPWIKRIAVNTALKVIRKRKLNFIDIEEYNIQLEDVTEEPFRGGDDISEEVILKLIRELPDGYRTIFNLFIVEGMSHKEIAEQLNISVQTSKSQLSKAKKILRKKLKEQRSTKGGRNFKNYNF